MTTRTPSPDQAQQDELVPNTWKWKRLRNIAVSVEVWPLKWHFGPWRHDDFCGGQCGFGLGPLGITLHYNALDGAVAYLIGPHCEMDVQP